MAPVETQKAPAVGMSDADDAEEDGGALRCYSKGCSRETLLMAGDGVREGVCVCVCVCVCVLEREGERGGREGGKGERESPFPHTRCL